MNKKSTVILLLIAVIITASVVLGIMIYPIVSDRMEDETKTDETAPDTGNELKEEESSNKAPDFAVIDKDGNEVTLHKLLSENKKPIIINFWATWCPPCVGELPHFEAMYKEYGEKIDFLMVNLTDGYDETIEKVNTFTSTNSYTFPVYFDAKAHAAATYQISSIPLTVLINEKGEIIGSKVGAMNEETLKGYIDMLIGE